VREDDGPPTVAAKTGEFQLRVVETREEMHFRPLTRNGRFLLAGAAGFKKLYFDRMPV
jgi:hypothetical protein